MGTELANVIAPMSAIETVVVNNDLSRLTPEQRWDYYRYRRESIGLNPAARPFQYIVFQGKLTLYADKGCAEQLRALHKIRTTIDSKDVTSGILCVTVTAHAPDGRTATDIGAVPVEGLKGEDLAKAMKKAVTQGNRRSTLALLGLGEQDMDEMDGVQRFDTAAVHDPKGLLPSDHATGEPEKKEQPVPSGPVNWKDDDQWPAGDPTIATMKLVGVRVSSRGDKRWITTTWDDGCGAGEIQAVTWHLSSEPVLASGVGRVFDVMYMRKDKANQLLSAKEVTK